ncbi:MAG: hypothetical protein MJ134_07630 [Lachnospiraceae bacterium]|nr:hypothetical protein [Lachnospiraceae bacterium]
MEEYTQITLMDWLEWKEDIRKKLAETAGNFVHIGYRLKQIRDSGMYDGAADVFEFAQKEYGLGKSTVSRFIAINEKFSEGGNSLKLKAEYMGLGSSKLSEMLTLPDEECLLITEKTTVKEIRELKEFIREEKELEKVQPVAETVENVPEKQENVPEKQENVPEKQESVQNPVKEAQIERRDDSNLSQLQKLMVSYFENLPELLNAVIPLVYENKYKDAMELMNPSDNKTFNKGIVFLFMYSWDLGIKYRIMGQAGIFEKNWQEFLLEIYDIYADIYENGGIDIHKEYYSYLYQEKVEETQQNQGVESAVATSQQTEKTEEKEEKIQDENTILDMEKVQKDETNGIVPGISTEAAGRSEGIETSNQLPENDGSVQEESGDLRQMENQGRETASDNPDSNPNGAGDNGAEPYRESDRAKKVEPVDITDLAKHNSFQEQVRRSINKIENKICIPLPDLKSIKSAIEDCEELLGTLKRMEWYYGREKEDE